MDDARTERAKKIVVEDPDFARLAGVCGFVKPPDGAVLISKAVSAHGLQIYDYYFVDQTRKDIYEFISRQVIEADWNRTRAKDFMGYELYEFEKERYRINLQLGGIGPDANFSISCIDSSSNRNEQR